MWICIASNRSEGTLLPETQMKVIKRSRLINLWSRTPCHSALCLELTKPQCPCCSVFDTWLLAWIGYVWLEHKRAKGSSSYWWQNCSLYKNRSESESENFTDSVGNSLNNCLIVRSILDVSDHSQGSIVFSMITPGLGWTSEKLLLASYKLCFWDFWRHKNLVTAVI